MKYKHKGVIMTLGVDNLTKQVTLVVKLEGIVGRSRTESVKV